MIETASAEDFDAIDALNVAAYEEFSVHLGQGAWDIMRRNLSNIAERAAAAEFLVCRDGGAVVGSVAYCRAGNGDPAMFGPDMASVLLLAVHPAHRGKGMARALTAACIARAQRDGAVSIGLFTSELMQSAQHIYQALGFERESELPRRHGVRYFRYVLPLVARVQAANNSLQARRP